MQHSSATMLLWGSVDCDVVILVICYFSSFVRLSHLWISLGSGKNNGDIPVHAFSVQV